MLQLQRVLSIIYPDHCVMCETRVERQGGLCGACWSETPFLNGLVCNACGTSLPGEDGNDVLCDDCLATPRPWEAGRAALLYRDLGRRVVLSLKHADRLDLVPACASWMARAGRPVFTPKTRLVPIPAHWTRLLSRRYNQAVELSRALGKETGLAVVPDALVRTRRTIIQDGMTVEDRFANMRDAIAANNKRRDFISGREVCLIDDVMTSGATLSAATDALYDAGAKQVCTLVLARVAKAP